MKQHLLKLKSPIVLFSIFVAIAFYYLSTDFVSPSRNVLRHVSQYLFPKEVKFFSGNEKGTYHRIAAFAEGATKDGPIRVRNYVSEGATENLLRVASSQRAIALIQEDTIASSLLDPDFIDRDIRIIAPIYTEKLHILYWPIDHIVDQVASTKKPLTLRERDRPVDLTAFHNEGSLDTVKMATEATKDASVYLSHPGIRMNLGRPNAGTLLLSHALLERCGVSGFESREENLPFSEALKKFKSKEIHAVFFMTGSPLDPIQQTLDDGARLMAVRGVNLIRQLHDDFGFILRPSQFSDSYGTENNVATFGTRAVLVSSDDITKSEMLKVIERIQHSLKEAESSPEQQVRKIDGKQILPILSGALEDSVSVVKALSDREKDQMTKDILIFIVTVLSAFAVAHATVLRLVSGIKRKIHFSTLVDIEVKLITELRGRASKAAHKRAESELGELYEAWACVLADYQTGGLSEGAAGFLREEFDSAIERSRKRVAVAEEALPK